MELCTRNSMKFVLYFHIHHINIWYKYGWNPGLYHKVMTVCQRVRSTSQLIYYILERGG